MAPGRSQLLLLLLLAVLGGSADVDVGLKDVAVASGLEFVRALADDLVGTLSFTADIQLREEDWTGYKIPVTVSRNVTMRGQPDLWRVLDMGWLANKVQNRNGTTVLVQYIILYQFNKASTQAPGVDLYAPLRAGDWSVLALETGGMITDYCLPPSLASAISSAYQRPPFLPGTNLFEATAPQPAGPNCTNDTNAHPLKRCWAHVGRHIDFSGAAAYVDPVGKSVPNGYFSHLVNVLVMCIHIVSEDCVAQYGPLVCMAITLADAEGRNQSPPPPEAASSSPPPLAIGDSGAGGAPASSGGKAASDSSSSSGDTSAVAAAVGGAVGGAILLGLVAAAIVVVRRRKRGAAAAATADGGDWKGKEGASGDMESGGCLPFFGKRGASGPGFGGLGGREEDSSGSVHGVPAGANSMRRSEAGASSKHGGGGADGAASRRGSKAGSAVSLRQAGGGSGCTGANDLVVSVGTKASELDTGGGGDGDGEDSGPTPTASLTGGSAGVSSRALQRQTTANSAAHPGPSPGGSQQQRALQQQHRQSSRCDDGSGFSTPGPGTATGSTQLQAPVSTGGGVSGMSAHGGMHSSGTGATSLGEGGPHSHVSHMSTATDLSDVMVTRCTPRRPDVQVGPEAADKVTLLPVVRGKGSFGKVYEGMYQGDKVAVKVLTGLPEGDQAETAAARAAAAAGGAPAGPSVDRLLFALGQEVEVLGRCRHPNVVRLMAACLQPPRYCLVMELMETSLECMVNRAPGRLLPLHTVLQISLDIARALEYLHPTVVHRDLKPGNVLINGAASDRPTAKLTDFGLSRLRHTVRSTAHPLAGTPAYIAPECYDVNNRTVTHQADMYSFGVLIYTLLAGQEPWRNYSVPAIAYKVAALRERPPLDQLGDRRCPQPLRALIRQCFEHDPRRRPAAAEAAKELGVLEAQVTARHLASLAASAPSSGAAHTSHGRSSTNLSSALGGPITTTNGGTSNGASSSNNASPGSAAAAPGAVVGGVGSRAAAAALLGNGSSSHRLKAVGSNADATGVLGAHGVTAGAAGVGVAVAVAPLVAAAGSAHSGALSAAAPPSGTPGLMHVTDAAAFLSSSQPGSGAPGSAADAAAGLNGAADVAAAASAAAAAAVDDDEHLPPPPSVDASVAAALAAFVGSGIGPAAGMAGMAHDVGASGRSITLEDSTLSSVELIHAKWGDPMCPSGGPATRNTTASGAAAGHGGGAGSGAASHASTAANAGAWATPAASSNGNARGGGGGGGASIGDGLALGQSLGLGPDLMGLGSEFTGVGIGQGLLGATQESDMSQSELMGQLGVVVLEAAPEGGAGGRGRGAGGGGSGGSSPNALAAGLVSFPVLPVGVGALPGGASVGGSSSSVGGGVGLAPRQSGGGGGGGNGGGRARGGARSSSGTSLELRKAAVVAAAVAAVVSDGGGGGGGRSIGGPSMGGGMGAGGGSLEPVSEVDSDYMSCDGQSEEQAK
ncbi:hypothetical protein HXX76_002285 [Chlamydomonas incerta]|uniref:Protein kinase domain-containing protein n=1 Tax=Chlamydomonas incerta TaxID=51695 RepID=A0A836B0D2_CHLIN|nr:hypothetical protein HXX76_002285 [Chlamydomonas incerta]|eukprot:KAG2443946.1 hypothetical protein HXX76_002285 [Chlamydomonas incerta]